MCETAVAATEQTRGGKLRSIGKGGEHRFMSGEAVLAAQTQSATIFAGPLGVRDQGETGDANRIVDLGLLDRRVLGILKVSLNRVRAVGVVTSPVTAGQGLEVRVVLLGAGTLTAETDMTDHAFGAGRYPLGQHLGKCFEQHFAYLHRDLPATHNSAGMPGVQHRAWRGDDLDGCVEPLVDRDVGVDQAFEHVDAGGEGLGEIAIHRRPALWVGAGKVEGDAFTVEGHPCTNVHRLVGNAVVVQPVLGRDGPSWQLRDLAQGAFLGVVEESVDIELDGLPAITFQ